MRTFAPLGALAAVTSSYKLDQPLPASNDRPLFCYYTNWSQYRPGNGQFWPEDIPANLCTHIIFSFGYVDQLSSGEWGVVPFEWNDQDSTWSSGLYSRINALKSQNPSLKTSLAIGGWNHGNEKWTEMVNSQNGIAEFSRNSLQYVKDHGFDGLDLDWEYPAKCTIDCSAEGDGAKFKQLYRQLRANIENDVAFGGIELTVAVGIGEGKVIEVDEAPVSYDPADLTDYFDYVHLMTYDMHGHWEDKTGHQAMLHKYTPDQRLNYTTNYEWVLDTWINTLGANPQKMTLGLPSYGRSFKLKNPETDHGLLAECDGPNNLGLYSGAAGEFTREPGYLAYYEICQNIRQKGWTSVWNDEIKAPYAHGQGDWVGYDDPDSIVAKVQMAKQYNLGGIMNWAIDVDDFDGSFCGQGPYPLLNAAKTEWNSNGGSTIVPTSQSSSSISPSPSSSSSSSSTSTLSTPPSGSCQHGSYVPDPAHCEKYFLCSNVNLISNTCPSGLFFDTSISQCNWEAAVDCCNGQRPCPTK